MDDNRTRRATRDSTRIKISQERELRYWTQELGVDEEALKEAVQAVGPMVDDVMLHLAHRGKLARRPAKRAANSR